MNPASTPPRLSMTQVLLCGAAIVTLSMGIRHGFGLWLQPITMDRGWSRETFSLAMDIGMYLGEILRQSATRLQWKALKGNKQEADYGQPILQPFKGGLVCNPVRLAITLAYGLADGTYKGTRLRELYETWRARTE